MIESLSSMYEKAVAVYREHQVKTTDLRSGILNSSDWERIHTMAALELERQKARAMFQIEKDKITTSSLAINNMMEKMSKNINDMLGGGRG